MITTDSNFIAANAKKMNEPVWLAQLEKDWLSALLTDYNQWLTGSGGDYVTNQGALRIIKAPMDAMARVTGYGDATIDLEGGEAVYARIRTSIDTQLTSLVINAKKNSSGTQILNLSIWEVTDSIGSNPENSSWTFVGIETGTFATNTPTTSFADITLTLGIAANLLANRTYLIELANDGDPGDSVTVKQWIPNETIFGSHAGYKEGALQLGQIRRDMSSGLAAYDLVNDFLDGNMWMKTLTLEGFSSSYGNVHTSAWVSVKNQSGTPTAPSVAGELRLSTSLPIGTSVAVQVYGNSSGVDAGQTNLGTIADGGSLTAYAWYKFVITMSTTLWSATPEVNAAQAYFGVFEKIVFSSDQFNNYRPIIGGIPSFEAGIDPKTCKVNLAEFVLEVVLDKEGYAQTNSWFETFLTSYKVLGMELRMYFGFREIVEGSFINYARGVLHDYEYKENSVAMRYRDQLMLIKDPLLVDVNSELPPVIYNMENPIDVLLELDKRYVPKRLINETSYTDIKTNFFSEWKVYRPITETVKDAKTLHDELCELLGVCVVQRQDGKYHLINLFDETTAVSATFDDDTTDEIGKCEFNFKDRINVCKVRCGYWDHNTNKEAIDKYYETAVDTQSIIETGKNTDHVIESKWLPKDHTVDGTHQALIVANRIIQFFGYGIWQIKRSTSTYYSFLQEGDFVNVTGSQILYYGITNPCTKRGVILKRIDYPEEGRIEFIIFLLKPLYPTMPANAPTSLSFTGLSTTSMTLNWTKGSGADGTIWLRKAGSAPAIVPISGQVYAVGDILSDGSVVAYIGTASSAALSGLTAQTEYYYRGFSYNVVGSRYSFKTNSYLSGSKWTDSVEPANYPTNLVITVIDDTVLKVEWTKDAEQQDLLLMRASSAVADIPVDGNGYVDGNTIGTATVKYSGSGNSVTITGLTNGVTYHFAVHPFNGSVDAQKNYKTGGTPLTGSKACTVAEPTAQITSFALSVTTSPKRVCHLTWTPESPRSTGIIILGKSGTISDSPSDSTAYTDGQTIGSSKVIFVGDSAVGMKDYTTDVYDTFKAFTYNGTTTPNYYLTGAPSAIES